jgi:hypothetical protein
MLSFGLIGSGCRAEIQGRPDAAHLAGLLEAVDRISYGTCTGINEQELGAPKWSHVSPVVVPNWPELLSPHAQSEP